MFVCSDYLFKVLMIGNSGVGKSCLLLRFADDQFQENFMPTIGVDFKIRTLDSDDKVCKLQIWDTAGQERFKTITSSYYKGAHGIIVIYDITDRDSFNSVHTWMSEVEKYTNDNITRILVGNKTDLEDKRAVSFEEGQEMANHYCVRFLETSAKVCKNVDQAFQLMTREIKNNVAQTQPRRPDNVPDKKPKRLTDSKSITPKKSGCC